MADISHAASFFSFLNEKWRYDVNLDVGEQAKRLCKNKSQQKKRGNCSSICVQD